MNYSIVPELINSKKIKFFDERGVHISICEPSFGKFVEEFQEPFILVDIFAKKTTREIELKTISIDELKEKGLIITTSNVTKQTRWAQGQKVMYRIELKNNKSPESKPCKNVPEDHLLKMDINNKKITLVGKNAGYPHFRFMIGNVERGRGPWVDLKEVDE